MEHEHTSTEQAQQPEPTPETIEARITEELAKVVGIDQELLGQYAAFLGTMPVKPVESLLKALKKEMDEQTLPLLEVITASEDFKLAELAILQLGSVQSYKVAQLLAQIDTEHANKKVRKAARKSLYKLKSAGIDVETSHKPLLRKSKHEPYKCMMSAVDGSGTQLIILSEEMLAGDLHLLQVVANEETGITEAYSKRGMTKKMFANLPATFAREAGGLQPMLAEIDYDYARSLVAEIEAIGVEAGEELPGDYLSIKEFFGLDTLEPVPSPIYDLIDTEALKNDPHFLRSSEELFQYPTLLSWLLPVSEMGDFAQELLDQDDSVIEVSPQFQQERKEEVYQKVVNDHFDESAIQRLRRRLEIMAYIFFLKDDEEDAKRSLAAAMELSDASAETLKNHPFIHKLIVDSLEVAGQVLEDGYDPESLEREEYVVVRDEEGNLTMQYFDGE